MELTDLEMWVFKNIEGIRKSAQQALSEVEKFFAQDTHEISSHIVSVAQKLLIPLEVSRKELEEVRNANPTLPDAQELAGIVSAIDVAISRTTLWKNDKILAGTIGQAEALLDGGRSFLSSLNRSDARKDTATLQQADLFITYMLATRNTLTDYAGKEGQNPKDIKKAKILCRRITGAIIRIISHSIAKKTLASISSASPVSSAVSDRVANQDLATPALQQLHNSVHQEPRGNPILKDGLSDCFYYLDEINEQIRRYRLGPEIPKGPHIENDREDAEISATRLTAMKNNFRDILFYAAKNQLAVPPTPEQIKLIRVCIDDINAGLEEFKMAWSAYCEYNPKYAQLRMSPPLKKRRMTRHPSAA